MELDGSGGKAKLGTAWFAITRKNGLLILDVEVIGQKVQLQELVNQVGAKPDLLTLDELKKVHHVYGHPKVHRFFATLKLDGQHAKLSDVAQVCWRCLGCETGKCTISKPESCGKEPVGMPIDTDGPEFNKRVSIDLLFIQKRPILVVLDENTRYMELDILKTKAAPGVWASFKAIWLGPYDFPTQLLSDNGSEFATVWAECEKRGVLVLCTAPHSPQSDGKNERSHRTLLESLRATLIEAKLPAWVWPIVLKHHIVRAYNRVVHTAKGTSPLLLRGGHKGSTIQCWPGQQVLVAFETDEGVFKRWNTMSEVVAMVCGRLIGWGYS